MQCGVEEIFNEIVTTTWLSLLLNVVFERTQVWIVSFIFYCTNLNPSWEHFVKRLNVSEGPLNVSSALRWLYSCATMKLCIDWISKLFIHFFLECIRVETKCWIEAKQTKRAKWTESEQINNNYFVCAFQLQ